VIVRAIDQEAARLTSAFLQMLFSLGVSFGHQSAIGTVEQMAPLVERRKGSGRMPGCSATRRRPQRNQFSANTVVLWGAMEGHRHEDGIPRCDCDSCPCRRRWSRRLLSERPSRLLPATVGRFRDRALRSVPDVDTAMGHAVSKPEAVRMGLLTPAEQPSPPATLLATRLVECVDPFLLRPGGG
jgi:hypothetical protein